MTVTMTVTMLHGSAEGSVTCIQLVHNKNKQIEDGKGSLQCRHHGEHQLNCCSNYVKHICAPAPPHPPPPQQSTTPLRCSVMVSIVNTKTEVVQPEQELHVSVITAVDQ